MWPTWHWHPWKKKGTISFLPLLLSSILILSLFFRDFDFALTFFKPSRRLPLFLTEVCGPRILSLRSRKKKEQIIFQFVGGPLYPCWVLFPFPNPCHKPTAVSRWSRVSSRPGEGASTRGRGDGGVLFRRLRLDARSRRRRRWCLGQASVAWCGEGAWCGEEATAQQLDAARRRQWRRCRAERRRRQRPGQAAAARNRKPRAASRSQGWTGGACKQKKSRARRRCTQHQPDSAVSRRQGGATCYWTGFAWLCDLDLLHFVMLDICLLLVV